VRLANAKPPNANATMIWCIRSMSPPLRPLSLSLSRNRFGVAKNGNVAVSFVVQFRFFLRVAKEQHSSHSEGVHGVAFPPPSKPVNPEPAYPRTKDK
jgi:hypothetical protein